MKKKVKARPVRGTGGKKKAEKKLITGKTEVFDFDLDEEMDEGTARREPAKKTKKREESEAAGARAEAKKTGRKSANDAGEAGMGTWDQMPEAPVTLGEETLELLELEELSPGQEELSPRRAGAKADYVDFVPKKRREGAAAPGEGLKTAGGRALRTSAAHESGGKQKKGAQQERGGSGAAGKKKGSGAAGKKKGSAASGRRKEGFFDGFGAMDRVIAATGVLVIFAAIFTLGMLTSVRSDQQQVAAMAEVGEKLETIGIAGEGVLTAVADARIAALEAADYVEPEEESGGEYDEKELTRDVSVGLKLTSVQRDLKIKFTNKSSGKLIANQAFEVKIEGPEKLTKTDEDKDGIIYISSLSPGEYTVTVTAPEEIDGNAVKGVKSIVTVKDQIEYKKIDVADEVKSESQVNAAIEDTAVAVQTETILADTVEWLESTRTLVGGGVSYEAVSKSDIPDPSATASLSFAHIAQNVATGEVSALFERAALPARPLGVAAGSKAREAGLVRLSSLSGNTPQDVTVESVSVSASASSAKVGDAVTVTATVKMSDGSSYDGDVSWSASGGEVSGSGSQATVKASGAGSVRVTAAAGGKSGECTISFEEEKPAATVSEVTLSASATGAVVGDTVTVTAAVKMSDGSSYGGDVSWSASGGELTANGSQATLKATEAGTVKVTATAGDRSASMEIAVSAAVKKVTKLTIPAELSLQVGATGAVSLAAEPADATDKSVEWSSSDAKIATVDANGTVKAVAAGTASITAKAKDGSGVTSNVCKVTVTADVSVSLEAPGSVNAGEEKQLKWTTTGEIDSAKTTVTSSDTKIATVDNGGKVKAVAQGKVTITVKVTGKNGKTASASGELTVNPAGSVTIALSPASATVKVGSKQTIKATVTTVGGKGLTWKSGDESVAKIVEQSDTACTIEALKPGNVSITATSKEKTDVSASCAITVTVSGDLGAALKDKSGNQLYYKEGDTYKAATVADYYKYDTFYRQKDSSQYRYTGWQNLDGKRYYFDKNGNAVTGEQVILGVKYSFNGDGSLQVSGAMGIDVSKHNGSIDWNAVKNAGVDFVIIRCGYRGSATGVLVEDPKFRANIQGATAAGIKVGIYFFSQAVNEVEAVEEASMAISLIRSYKITYPVYIDVEAANGRADGMDAATRTKVVNAFCQTIRNSGYTAGIYANKTWLTSKLNVSALSSYKIWLAQYASTPTYSGRYEMWQHSSTGRISGISGNVDLNISYMSY